MSCHRWHWQVLSVHEQRLPLLCLERDWKSVRSVAFKMAVGRETAPPSGLFFSISTADAPDCSAPFCLRSVSLQRWLDSSIFENSFGAGMSVPGLLSGGLVEFLDAGWLQEDAWVLQWMNFGGRSIGDFDRRRRVLAAPLKGFLKQLKNKAKLIVQICTADY